MLALGARWFCYVSVRDSDLKIEGFGLWVENYAYSDVEDYWDGNWVNVLACCEFPGGKVKASGALVHLSEIAAFAVQCKLLYEEKAPIACLPCMEPNLLIELRKIDELGHIAASISLTPDHLHQTHSFEFEIDQSYLPGIIASCDSIVSRFPIRGLNPEGKQA